MLFSCLKRCRRVHKKRLLHIRSNKFVFNVCPECHGKCTAPQLKIEIVRCPEGAGPITVEEEIQHTCTYCNNTGYVKVILDHNYVHL